MILDYCPLNLDTFSNEILFFFYFGIHTSLHKQYTSEELEDKNT